MRSQLLVANFHVSNHSGGGPRISETHALTHGHQDSTHRREVGLDLPQALRGRLFKEYFQPHHGGRLKRQV